MVSSLVTIKMYSFNKNDLMFMYLRSIYNDLLF